MKTFMFFVSAALALAQQTPGGPEKKLILLNKDSAMGRVLTEQKLKAGPLGRWWSNPEIAQKLNLTADQLKKMDDIFQQNRLQLIDLNASLQKAEAILEPLVDAEQPDDSKVAAQIDLVAQARADLEKSNARMLWSIRRVLTPDQWKTLQGEPKPKPRK